MDDTLLHQAATQAKTGWLEKALTILLPQVWDLTTQTPHWQEAASNWAQQIDRLFEEKKLITPAQQKNRRTDIANALRTIDPKHPAIPFVLLPSEIYTALNNEQANRLNARANKFFSIQQANELVQRAIALLDSEKPDEVAAGLAVLVGRRIGEILISQFQPKTAYSLLFSEAVKRRGEIGLEFEIPTLAPAEQVLRTIQHLKQVWSIEDLKVLNLSGNHLKRRINSRYSGVPHACRQHFADLVPGREAENDDGERLYTHLFRAVYAEIATYYYKPQWVPDHRFKAEIQGHFKFTEDGQKIPNYSARQNYDDYLIRDRSPGEPGVKLGTPGVQTLEVFQKEGVADAEGSGMITSQRLAPGTINALLYRAVDRLLFSKQWSEAATGLVLVTGRALEVLLKTSPEEKSQFSILVHGLEVPTLTGASQVLDAWRKLAQLSPLPAVQVETAIQEVCDRTFQDLAPVRSVQDLRAVYAAIALHWFCPPAVQETAFLQAIGAAETAGFETVNCDRGVRLHQHNVQILEALEEHEEEEMPEEVPEEVLKIHKADTSQFSPDISSSPEPKLKSRHRRKTLAVDPDLLRTVVAAFGIEIRGKGGAGNLSYEAALAQVLTQLAQKQASPLSQPSSRPTHSMPRQTEEEGAIAAIKDQAKTLAWLTGRVEALEHQIETLKQERDEAIAKVAQVGESSQLEQLLQENQQLKQERDEATGKLQTFRQLLIGSSSHPEEQPVEHQPSQDQPSQERQPATPPRSTQPSPRDRAEPPPRKRVPEEEAIQHIRRAVAAIMACNDQKERAFDDKWYISFPVVQTLLRANGLSANQKTVSVVFEEMKQELERHHDRHGIGSRHNRRHPNLEKITEIVDLN